MALENFTTYTEVDPLGHLTEAAALITVAGMTPDETSYVYKDMGVDAIEAFVHAFAAKFSNPVPGGTGSDYLVGVWGVTNALTTLHGLWVRADSDLVMFFERGAAGTFLRLRSGSVSDTASLAVSLATWYYGVVVRTGTALHAVIYSDSDFRDLVAVMGVESNDDYAYRYVMPMLSWGYEQTVHTIDAQIANLDLAFVGPLAIAGRVVREDTVTPLANVRLDLKDDAETILQSVLTDADGYFAIGGIDNPFTGHLVPTLAAWTFAPTARDYKANTLNLFEENFVGTMDPGDPPAYPPFCIIKRRGGIYRAGDGYLLLAAPP